MVNNIELIRFFSCLYLVWLLNNFLTFISPNWPKRSTAKTSYICVYLFGFITVLLHQKAPTQTKWWKRGWVDGSYRDELLWRYNVWLHTKWWRRFHCNAPRKSKRALSLPKWSYGSHCQSWSASASHLLVATCWSHELERFLMVMWWTLI